MNASHAPPDCLNRVLLTKSCSESDDPTLKIALAYHRVRVGSARIRVIGRKLGYHGINFADTAVDDIGGNRKLFSASVAGVDHLRHEHDLAHNALTKASLSTPRNWQKTWNAWSRCTMPPPAYCCRPRAPPTAACRRARRSSNKASVTP